MMTPSRLAPLLVAAAANSLVVGAIPTVAQSQEVKKLNNLVSVLLEESSNAGPEHAFTFIRKSDGWIFVAAECEGQGTAQITLDAAPEAVAIIEQVVNGRQHAEAMRHITKGEHRIRVGCSGNCRVAKLLVKAIPELIHCGLGFDPAIKSYGRYDMAFLKQDVLPNVTTLIVPASIELQQSVIDDWHRQGKKFVGEVGINAQATTADEHYRYWAGFLKQSPFLDGIVVNEFIVNNPASRPDRTPSPERLERMSLERQRYHVYGDAIKRLRADRQQQRKTLYGYVGGSAKKLNQETIGPEFIRTIIDCGYAVALERYLFEVSSEGKAKDALQAFVDGILDWETKKPGIKKHMIITFGLFSMPPGSINKQPNVDYHVWMDQQMNIVANHPAMAGVAGLSWWTTTLADEETVRFVGKLYRHYAIDGGTAMLTTSPLFLKHIQNADFEKGLEGWTLRPAEPGSIQARSFPRFGRIEGRYMGLGRPADPEHIGDTFLWMKRSAKGPNTFSQTIKDL
jgi:hypothetical protein